MISVIIPTYNRVLLLQRALESVFSQTLMPDEVIVVDDGSSDSTKEMVQNLDSSLPLRYLIQSNKGVSSARNLGIKEACGDYLFFLDSDDTWESSKLEKQMSFHKKNPHILFSHTDEKWIRNNKIIKQSKKHKKTQDFCFVENLSTCKIGASCICVHKTIFDKIGLFNEKLEICEDYEFYLRVLNEYELGLINDKLTTKYAGHEQLSVCDNIDKYRLQALKSLLELQMKEIYRKEVIKEIKRKEIWQ